MRVVVTVDYEVFGDGSGSLRGCVCGPGGRLRSVLREAGIRGVFFVEPLELMARAAAGREAAREVDRVVEQIAELADEGHELGLHLHPQWLPAAVGRAPAREWAPLLWRFGDLPAEAMREALDVGREWILAGLRSAGIAATDIVSFRAGGWCVQPLAATTEALRAAGFRVDSSVAPGLFLGGPGAWYDFRDAPSQHSWVLDAPGAGTPLLEVPIATARVGWLGRMASEAMRRLPAGPGRFPEGCAGSYAGPDRGRPALASRLRRMASASWTMADYCSLGDRQLLRLARSWGASRDPGVLPGDVPLVLIGHTKNFTPAAEESLGSFLSQARGKGWVGSTFKDLVRGGRAA